MRIIIFLIFGVMVLFANGGTLPLVYESGKMDTNKCFIYEYSNNIDKFAPITRAYLFFNNSNELEEFFVFKKDTIASYLGQYMLNWNMMMFQKYESIYLLDKSKLSVGQTLRASYEIDFKKKQVKPEVINKTKDGFKTFNTKFKFKNIPTYFYHITDLTPLWFTLRFYPLKKKHIFIYNNNDGFETKIKIKYLGIEKIKVYDRLIACHKFELTPEMNFIMKFIMKPKKAYIWLTAEDQKMYMVKYINYNQRSGFSPITEYRLRKVIKMNKQEWIILKKKYGINL